LHGPRQLNEGVRGQIFSFKIPDVPLHASHFERDHTMVPWYCQPRRVGTAVANDDFPEDSAASLSASLLDPYLYECTNKMVLSTKSAERENIKGCGRLAFDPGAA